MSKDWNDKLTKGISIIKWVKIFLSPFFGLSIIGGVIINLNSFTTTINYIVFGIFVFAGILFGVLLAEYARRNFGTIEFDSRIDASPDIDEWLKPVRKEENNKS